MKTKLTFEFESINEAQSFLGTIGGGHKVEVSAATVTEAKEEPVAVSAAPSANDPLGIGKELSRYTKAELKKVCAERGIPYSSSAKNADLIALINAPQGALAPQVEEEVAEVPVPPVIEPTLVAPPAAVVTPITEVAPQAAPAPVEAPQAAVTQESILAEFTAAYEGALVNGVAQEMLDTTVKSQIRALNYQEGTRLSQMSGAHLQQFVGMFKNHLITLTNKVQSEPINYFV